jgi:diguanylate cyclase (GGDEF)-like protein
MPAGPSPTLQTTPAVAAVVAVLTGLVAAVQFSIPSSQTLGIATLYLWPIAIAALWFGVRVAVGVVSAVMLVQIAWYASVPHGLSTGGGVAAVCIRGATYLFIASVVGEFASRLRRTALTDPLTRLPNRRAFFDEARRRSLSTDSLGVVTGDVDGLKQINDRHGHEAGDAAIVAAGRALRAYLGKDAFVCRFGGDEFLAITTPEIARRIGATTDAIAGLRIGASVHSTVDGALIDEAIAAADRSLYRAKHRAGAERAARVA